MGHVTYTIVSSWAPMTLEMDALRMHASAQLLPHPTFSHQLLLHLPDTSGERMGTRRGCDSTTARENNPTDAGRVRCKNTEKAPALSPASVT